ncbi:MAG: 50S ribosomal protein L29 [Nitrospirae bacterium]|nr:50S ribosomal protein L29 [Nitrospirota bacterium]
MRPSELAGLTVEELNQKEQDLRRELFNLRFQLAKGELTNNQRVKAVRKDIARVLTLITAKGSGQIKEKQDA